jgi:hypothetical protein
VGGWGGLDKQEMRYLTTYWYFIIRSHMQLITLAETAGGYLNRGRYAEGIDDKKILTT